MTPNGVIFLFFSFKGEHALCVQDAHASVIEANTVQKSALVMPAVRHSAFLTCPFTQKFSKPQMQVADRICFGTQVRGELSIFPMINKGLQPQDGISLQMDTRSMQHSQESQMVMQAMQTIDQAANHNRV